MSEHIRGWFEPDFVMMLVDVFGEVCAQVETASSERPSEDVRNTLAKAIMLLAQHGETDPAALKAHALASLEHLSPGPQVRSLGSKVTRSGVNGGIPGEHHRL